MNQKEKNTHHPIIKSTIKVETVNGKNISGICLYSSPSEIGLIVTTSQSTSTLTIIPTQHIKSFSHYPNYDLSTKALICQYLMGCKN